MDELCRPLLIVSLVAVLLAVLVTLGSPFLTTAPPLESRVAAALGNSAVASELQDQKVDLDDARDQLAHSSAVTSAPPGIGIPDMALVNGLLLMVMVLTSLPLLIGDRATGTVQGVVSIVGGFLGLVGGIALAIVAFVALLLMVSLLLAVPFGTLAYLAIYGSFNTSAAGTITSILLVLQGVAFVCLVLAHQRFLKSTGLVLLFATAILLTFVTSILHSIVPGILVSITDAVAALIAAIAGAIWSLAILLGGLVATVRLLRVGRQGGDAAMTRPGR